MTTNTFPTTVINNFAALNSYVQGVRETVESLDISPCLVNCLTEQQVLHLVVNEIEGAGKGAAIALRYRDGSFRMLLVPAVSPDAIPGLAARLDIPVF